MVLPSLCCRRLGRTARDGQEAEDVDVENGERLGVGDFLDAAEQPAAGVVDEHVDAPEPLNGLLDGALSLIG
jgi:hypothetical protein